MPCTSTQQQQQQQNVSRQIHTNRQTDRQTNRQAGRQAELAAASAHDDRQLNLSVAHTGPSSQQPVQPIQGQACMPRICCWWHKCMRARVNWVFIGYTLAAVSAAGGVAFWTYSRSQAVGSCLVGNDTVVVSEQVLVHPPQKEQLRPRTKPYKLSMQR
jgi:hypothetical protein